MTFRTESELVFAANAARDLTNLVVAFLELWRKHAQGVNDVFVPSERSYTVVFEPNTEPSRVKFRLIYTKTITWSQATYYDAGDDNFDEHIGADNISGYVGRSRDALKESFISIPFRCLLMSRADMEADIKETAIKDRAEKAEKKRLAAIAEHEAAILKLKGVKPGEKT